MFFCFQARVAQEPITSAGLDMIDGAALMMESAKQLAVTPNDPPTYQRYSEHSKAVSDAIKKLLSAIRENAPGQRECEAAGLQIERAIQVLDQACMKAVSQNLEPEQGNTLNVSTMLQLEFILYDLTLWSLEVHNYELI